MVRDELRELAQDHLPTALAFGLFVAFGLKLLAVSGGSITTAAILDEVNVFNALFGITLVASPYILTIIAMILVTYLDIYLTPLRLTIIFLPSLLFAPFSLVVPIYLCFIVFDFVMMFVTRDARVRFTDRGMAYAGIAIGVLFIIFIVLSPRMWLPLEHIDTATESYSGYVLSADAEELVILRDGDRRVLRMPSPRVVERQYCEERSGWWSESWDRPFLAVIDVLRYPVYPECDDLSTPDV